MRLGWSDPSDWTRCSQLDPNGPSLKSVVLRVDLLTIRKGPPRPENQAAALPSLLHSAHWCCSFSNGGRDCPPALTEPPAPATSAGTVPRNLRKNTAQFDQCNTLTLIDLPFLRPSCRDGLLGDGAAFGWRQGGGSGVPALGRAQPGQGDSGLVAGIWLLNRLWHLAGGLLDDLVGQLIGVSGAVSCASRHGLSIARVA